MMTGEQIKYMAERFLAWKLPQNFNPDNGISAKRPNYAPNVSWEPMGTNLLNYTQAESMVRHMIEGLPPERTKRQQALVEMMRLDAEFGLDDDEDEDECPKNAYKSGTSETPIPHPMERIIELTKDELNLIRKVRSSGATLLPICNRLRSYFVMFAGKPHFSNKGKVHRAADLAEAANVIDELYEAIERVWDAYGFDPSIDSSIWHDARRAMHNARSNRELDTDYWQWLPASAINARSDATTKIDAAEGESAIPKGDANE